MQAKTSIFKRMNCFKQQNSEENPLLILNPQISLKNNNELNTEQSMSPILQLQKLEEKQNLTMAINSNPVLENFTPQKIQEMYSPPEIINYEQRTGIFYNQNNQTPYLNTNLFKPQIV